MVVDTFFLLGLRISGIKNIEKPIEIPFYKKTIKDDFNPDQYRVKGIYGENGSGKTAIMIAVRIMTRILFDKNYLSDSVNQQLLIEHINKKTKKGFIEATFYSTYETDPEIYRYRVDFSMGADERVIIVREKLEKKNGRYSQNAYTPVYETQNGELLYFGNLSMLNYCREKTKNLLEQRSFVSFVNEISKAENSMTNPYIRQLYTLFFFALEMHVVIDGEDDHRSDVYQKMKAQNKTGVFREAESAFLYPMASTIGKHSQEIIIPHNLLEALVEHTDRLCSFIRIFKTDLKNIEIEKKEYGELYICRRIMVYNGYKLDEEYESRGIKKLMALFDALDYACKGSIVFIDELDSNINDVYLNKLIEYFSYYGKGQLCFTAHNLSPMSILRDSKSAISFISGINTVHTWTSNGNQNPANAYRDGFIEDSPFNVDATDFLGILGGTDD